MNADFKRKLPTPESIKKMYPVEGDALKARLKKREEIKKAVTGESGLFILIIGPCSADRDDAVLEYAGRLCLVQEQVKDKILIIPRVYTNKPRTTGDGYKGMLHQPDPNEAPDMLKGLIAIRKLHLRVLEDYGFLSADEMLYPENHRYLSDVLGYVSVGARSAENQQHRLVASCLDIPCGMKNPMSGDLKVMMNSIMAAQHPHVFQYAGWEVQSKGNPLAHAILRGAVNKDAGAIPNYHYEDLRRLADMYGESGLKNPALIVDTNHSNSNKQFNEEPRIANEIMHSRRHSEDIEKLVKGLMIESYLVDGNQKPDGGVYGKSITDACLGWRKTEKLIYSLAEQL